MRRRRAGTGLLRGRALPPALSYFVAVVLALLAQAARFTIQPGEIPHIAYVPFIMMSAFLGGWGPGVLTTGLCVVESAYFAPRPGGFTAQSAQNWLGLATVAFTGLAASILFERLWQARADAASHLEERSAMERELDARQRMLESVIANSPVAIALLRGEDFRYELVNPAHESLAPGVQAVGKTVGDVWPEAAAVALPLLERVRDQGVIYHTDSRLVPLRRGPDLAPEERYFEFSYVPLAEGAADSGKRILVVAMEVTEKQRAQKALETTLRELESTLAEKTVLLKEVHHRVKNNLAVIVSLLGMKAGAIENPEAQRALEDSQRRVRSIALIHEHLSGTGHLDRIDFVEYAQQLVQELGSIYGVAARGIAMCVEAEPVEIGIHRAVPCALILNELVSNSLKHAFPGDRCGHVRVRLRYSTPAELELTVEDDGIGCPRMRADRDGKSLGLRIVEILTKQLEGTLEQAGCAGHKAESGDTGAERAASEADGAGSEAEREGAPSAGTHVECRGTRFILRFRAGTSRRSSTGVNVDPLAL